MRRFSLLLSPFALIMAGCATISNDSSRLVTVDHYVRVKSAVPAIAGQSAHSTFASGDSGHASRGARAADNVVIFVHGAGTPAEVAFDGPYETIADATWPKQASMCFRWT